MECIDILASDCRFTETSHISSQALTARHLTSVDSAGLKEWRQTSLFTLVSLQPFEQDQGHILRHVVSLAGAVGQDERAELLGQKGATIWLTGLSASGKVKNFLCVVRRKPHSQSGQSTIATALEQHLLHRKLHAYRLDGDNIRFGLNKVSSSPRSHMGQMLTD